MSPAFKFTPSAPKPALHAKNLAEFTNACAAHKPTSAKVVGRDDRGEAILVYLAGPENIYYWRTFHAVRVLRAYGVEVSA